MKQFLFPILVLACLAMPSCRQQKSDKTLVQRSFHQDLWERFDYVVGNVEVKEATSFDLSLNISFTEAYPYDDFSMVFTVFAADGTPYRSRAYKFKLKGPDGQWNSQLADGCYTFDLPINQDFRINEAGTYRFQIEYRMPTTPIVGVRQMKLMNN